MADQDPDRINVTADSNQGDKSGTHVTNPGDTSCKPRESSGDNPGKRLWKQLWKPGPTGIHPANNPEALGPQDNHVHAASGSGGDPPAIDPNMPLLLLPHNATLSQIRRALENGEKWLQHYERSLHLLPHPISFSSTWRYCLPSWRWLHWNVMRGRDILSTLWSRFDESMALCADPYRGVGGQIEWKFWAAAILQYGNGLKCLLIYDPRPESPSDETAVPVYPRDLKLYLRENQVKLVRKMVKKNTREVWVNRQPTALGDDLTATMEWMRHIMDQSDQRYTPNQLGDADEPGFHRRVFQPDLNVHGLYTTPTGLMGVDEVQQEPQSYLTFAQMRKFRDWP
ncbi:hypothetical protein BBP40_003012 [Aspergillus hancockii]|nr:hypothetical protein BBP40_003012 [Aspergillus hancockii]